ncbi:hypothetical protein VPHD479_0372 [Vibrio phage D479]
MLSEVRILNRFVVHLKILIALIEQILYCFQISQINLKLP